MSDSKCELCGEPMPVGEEMFKYHGYSGDCPKPPLARLPQPDPDGWNAAVAAAAMIADNIWTINPSLQVSKAAGEIARTIRALAKPAESAAPPTREGEK